MPGSSRVVELFGHRTAASGVDWRKVVRDQNCPFVEGSCFKTRKSQPEVAIGTCTMSYGASSPQDVIICPNRLLERRQVFFDCLHLMTTHEPGNQIHLVSEVSVPGGSVDYFLVSVRRGRVADFVGIEFQTLDTTGTVWPERQRLLQSLGLPSSSSDRESKRPFGMNWKMTAKTILMQLHHKVATFEHVGRRLVLVVQNCLLEYMRREFQFGHLSVPALNGEPMHFHAYELQGDGHEARLLSLSERASTDLSGLSQALGLQAEARVEFDAIASALQGRISPATLLPLPA